MHATSLCKLFTQWRAAVLEQPLADFSGLKSGVPGYCRVAPRSATQLCEILRIAAERNIAVRIRAQGHSLNGSSLPRAGELLVSTHALRQIRFEQPGTVTAGSGIVLWVLERVLNKHGFALPVLNDGYPGPSVGGYLASGGFGPGSAAHGGFWDNVLEVVCVDGLGQLRRVAKGEPLFPWLFGSMGQLGVFVEAKLAIVAHAESPMARYPAGKRLSAPRLVGRAVPDGLPAGEDERLFWFTLFVPDEDLEQGLVDLATLERRHRGALQFAERYRYPIRPRGIAPPLLYPEARPFTATGAWGWLDDKGAAGVERLQELEHGFMALATRRAHYRRYLQSELPSGPGVYAGYFEPRIYAAFRALKSELDPKMLLDPGTVFEP